MNIILLSRRLYGPGNVNIVVGLYQAFSGLGNRLDGKSKTSVDSPRVQESHEIKRFVLISVSLENETESMSNK